MRSPMPTHRVLARNNAVASSNRMHDDTVARDYGFRGGLVPGADVWAYMAHPLVEAWGLPWLAQGSMEVRFRAPFYDGDEVNVVVTPDGDGAASLLATNQSGATCATGRALRHDTAQPLPALADFPVTALPDWPPPAASEAFFTAHPVLGTLDAEWSADGAAAYLDQVDESSPLLRDGAVAPPGWLARLTDFVLVANVTLGPWIFAQASLRHLAHVNAGDVVRARSRVAALYERGGHRFVDLDLLFTATGDRPVLCGRKTAIYQPRST
jgi:acyl dehydratase